MTDEEFLNGFDVLYNNITSNQAPGLNTHEICVFLTKAQDEYLKNIFNPKGNKYQEGFDGNQKRQIDFSSITKVLSVYNTIFEYTEDSQVTDKDGNTTYTRTESQDTSSDYQYAQAYDSNGDPIADHYIRIPNTEVTGFGPAIYDNRSNSKCATLPSDVWMIVNERVVVSRNSNPVSLVVRPISYDEYDRLMSKPFKRPLRDQAWRLINFSEANKADLVVGPSDAIQDYTVRYIKRPKPIIVGDLDGLTIDGYKYVGQTSPADALETSGCELDLIIHEEILQRAVELAKIAWTATGAENTEAVITAGQRSE